MGLTLLRSAETSAADQELDDVTVKRAQRGDRSAQAALVSRYERPVFAVISRLVGPERALVEDLAQETFLRALQALPRFDRGGTARLSTWLLTIATRLALGHLRRQPPRPDAVERASGLPVALPGPEQSARRRTLAAALSDAVGALEPPFRAAFLLREVHGLSYEEIAAALQIEPGTVKSRLARARAELQAALAEVHDDE
jgi:RNA polymerase sigma-70 factor (ECF subfamily)